MSEVLDRPKTTLKPIAPPPMYHIVIIKLPTIVHQRFLHLPNSLVRSLSVFFEITEESVKTKFRESVKNKVSSPLGTYTKEVADIKQKMAMDILEAEEGVSPKGVIAFDVRI